MNKVEKVIQSILKDSGMNEEECNEVKGIAQEMKASFQSEVIAATPIIVVAPLLGVIIIGPSAQVPYAPIA